MPAQTVLEARTHASFDALMWSLAHPGRVQTLQLEATTTAFDAIAESLLDLETTTATTDARLEAMLRATGARIVPLERAEFVFMPKLEDVSWLHRLERGSLLSPDLAATLVLGMQLEGDGPRLRLSGPGIDGALEVSVGGLPLGFWTTRAEIMAFPIGWDAILTDGSSLLGLPRTTRVEVI
jgi:alpha-D-ribose 1-methylphosphonate 5-triphosphate synthase subunit PhnH